jgi:uronate dehydrogenase
MAANGSIRPVSQETPKRKRLLITGAGGKVGTALRTHLRDRYDLRLLDVRRVEDAERGDQVVVANTANFEQLVEATRGVDAIAHLAIGWEARGGTQAALAQKTIDVDIRGVYNVLQCAHLNKVGCVVFASTNHVTGLNEQDGVVSRPELPVRPDGIYGAGKAFGEALGRYYADRMGVRFFAVRIANFNNRDEPGRDYAPGENRWLSPRDAASLFSACIEAEHIPFGIFYGVSKSAEKKWDLSSNKEILGWEPQDDGTLPEFRALYSRRGES